jgi:hypothetical protein
MENKMIISKNAWHYRLMSFFDMKIPTSLCPYFWKTVACFGMIAMFTVIALAIIWALFFLGGLMILYPNLPNGLDPVSFTFTLSLSEVGPVILKSLFCDLCLFGGIFVALYVVFSGFRRFIHGIIYDSRLFSKIRKHEDYDDYRWKKKSAQRESKNHKRENPGLIRSYMKARKSKFCPTLEFK